MVRGSLQNITSNGHCHNAEQRKKLVKLFFHNMRNGQIVTLSLSAAYTPSGGPVYVNPAAQSNNNQNQPQQNEAIELLTQTVYGFLDFTTTIGNTVMVFSPQSAPAAGEQKKPAATSSVIETKPSSSVSTATTSHLEIKPSKTIGKSTDNKKAISTNVNNQQKKISSHVEVKSGSSATVLSSVVEVRGGPPSTVESRSGPSIVVETRSGPSSVVQVRGGPSSVVEVRGGGSSLVEVRAGPPVVASKVEVREGSSSVRPQLSSIVEIRSSNDEPAISGNNILEPEYDFLSRQPSEVVDETYKVINLRPNSKFHLKPRQTAEVRSKVNVVTSGKDDRPTGVVTKLGGTVVKDGVTTVHETTVLGTYISGKYAQVLHSSSHVLQPHGKPKPTAVSSAPRILKTAAPSLHKNRPPTLEPTPAGSLHDETVALPLEALFSSAPAAGRSSRKHNSASRKQQEIIPTGTKKSSAGSSRTTRTSQAVRPSFRASSKNGFSKHFARTSTPEVATVSVFSETASVAPSNGRRFQQSSQRRAGFRPSTAGPAPPPPPPPSSTQSDNGGYTRRGYKPRQQQTAALEVAPTTSTSYNKFKLQRPTGRWQYKTTPKPRISIRRQSEDEAETTQEPPQPQYTPDDSENEQLAPEVEEIPVQVAPSEKEVDAQPVVEETIKVEISTPADFKDVYYEIATIKSPYTFQVGTVKNTRYITVTSTFEKNLESTETPAIASSSVTEPLTENILASTLAPHYEKDHSLPLDSSIATLPPIALVGDASTPPLETLTESFSTTQLLLKTHILPVIREGSNTTRYTLVQSYHVTRLVTAFKTLPPMEVYHFVPSKTLNEFNTRLEEAGSELHLELDFGDENERDDEDRPAALKALQPELDLANIGSDFDLADVDKTKLPEAQHLRLKKAQKPDPPQQQLTQPLPLQQPVPPQYTPEQLQQLALLRFLNPAAAALPQVITTSRPVLRLETVFESHVIPVFNGVTTSYSTISRPVATVSKTEYEYGTSTVPVPAVPPVNPLFPQQAPQFAVTSTPVVTQTVVTATESKVLKLTFGAKTAYTTIFSTKLVPTILTTYITASLPVPVQPTAPAFPGYYPPPYPQFPFVG
ncbi:uncharacterized protein [Anabrus simplex]|uniref:uncharacterized protein n=1 Tax=Anabrus simplex TaxID=316456 RepID=UPI0035A3A433